MNAQSSANRFSADVHIVEPTELFTEQLPPDDRYRAPIYQRRADGTKLWYANGMPGSISPDYTRRDGHTVIGPDDISALTEDLALDGVSGALLHPNVGLKIFDLDDPAFAFRCAEIYNEHVHELYREPFVPAAVVPVVDIDRAIAEVERVAELGFRAIELPMHNPPNAPYFSSMYEPLWAAIAPTGMLVSMHVGTGMSLGVRSDGGSARSSVSFIAPSSAHAYPTTHPDHDAAIVTSRTATGGFGGYGGQALITIPALVGGGVLERYPDLHFLLVETGARWLLNAMDAMDDAWHDYPGVREVNRQFFNVDGSRIDQFLPDELNLKWPYPLSPGDYVRRQIHVTFQDDWTALRNRELTGLSPLVWGNDYPHYEGSWPESDRAIADQCARAGLSHAEQAAVFGGTIRELLGLAA